MARLLARAALPTAGMAPVRPAGRPLLGGQPLRAPPCWRLRAPARPVRPAGPPRVRAASGSESGDEGLLAELRSKLQPLGVAFRQALQALWEAQRQWMQHALARAALTLALLAAAATAAANVWGVPAVNRRLMPQVQAAAAAVLQREVQLGAVRWLAPTGLAGMGPLASVGPVALGPSPVEASSLSARHITLGLDPLQSALQRRLVLDVRVNGAQVDLVQADNYSWFGFPEDTVPSARDFLPGASGGSGSGGTDSGSTPGGGGGGAAAASSSNLAATSTRISSRRRAATPAAAAPARPAAGGASSDARQRMQALASRAASSSQQLQVLVDRLTQELVSAAAAQQAPLRGPSSAGASEQAAEQQPAMVLMGLGGSATDLPGQPWRGSQEAGPTTSSSSGGSATASASSGDLLLDQQPSSGSTRGQELARAVPGGSGGGVFGGKFGWRRGPAAPLGSSSPDGQPLPSPGTPPVNQARRQQQLAALNAMRLQAGRGYTLRQQQQQQSSAAPAAVPAPALGSNSKVAAGASSGDASSRSQDASAASARLESEQGTALPVGAQQQQQEPQHRKKRRKGAAAGFFAAGQQQAQLASALEQQLAAAPAPALGSSSGVGSLPGPLPRPTAPAGSKAAALNKQLQPVAMPSGKLYSAGRTGNPLLQPAAGGTIEAAQAASALAMPSTAAAAVDAAAAAAAAAAGAPADQVLAVPPLTSEQRRAAVARINSLPSIVAQQYKDQQAAAAAGSTASSTAASEPAAEGEQAQGAAVPADSRATRWINGMGTLEAPEWLQPSARVSAAAQRSFGPLVVDPAAQHKKLGSAALPWSHQRPPASSLIGARLGSGSSSRAAEALHEAADTSSAASTAAAAAAGMEGPSATGPAVEGGEGAEVAPSQGERSDGDAGAKPATRRPSLLHPGYFTLGRGPSYTPAPPEALIDARARRTTLGTFVRGALEAAVSRLHVPEVAVGSIQLQGATVDAHVHGEELPRRFQDVSASVLLGKGYDRLWVDLSASPHERHPSSAKCTMPSPHAHRHLRHVTGLAAASAYQHNVAAAAAGDAAAAEAAAAAAEGRPNRPACAAAEEGLTAAAAYAQQPTGGRVRIQVEASGIASGSVPPPGAAPAPGVRVPTLDIRIRGQDLHAPILERLIELPMDIDAGRADGELRIYSYDADSWHFPEFYGRVNVRGARFHFWDATDDISGAHLDLVFERDQLYLHNARGAFGAVPMTLTGSLDLNPSTGQYRLTASVPGVEVNALRASLGLRPTPQPVAGALAGTLHVGGPLEKPVFSGTAAAVRPTPAQLADCEHTEALAALLAEPAAVGAFDRVPFASAGAVFALDTAAETMHLHALHAELVDGGTLRGSGRMWVSPRAEQDPSAVRIKAEGQDLAVEAVARRYMPEGMTLPSGMVVGRASLAATMQGSHMEPTIDVALQLPEASASAAVELRRSAIRASVASPSGDAAGTLHLSPPSFEAVKAALTQAEATALARPNVTGLDADVSLRGLDVAPLVSDEQALRKMTAQSGQPLRLRLNGRARVSGTVSQEGGAASSGTSAGSPGWLFAGDLGLESVRVNQLKLWQKLAGRLSVSGTGVSVHGKGLRANETLDLDLVLPLLAAQQAPQQADAAQPAQQEQQQQVAPEAAAAEADAAEVSAGGQPQAGAEAAAEEGTEGQATAVTAAPESAAPQAPVQQRGGGGLQLRCGPLQVAAEVDATGSQLDFKVAALKLDELELASLRGDLQEVSCSLNFGSHTGRGKLSLANPRYSGLRGDWLSGGFRWERDVVRLEKLVLQQRSSRYEVQGEYSIPASTPLPSSAADLTLGGSDDRGASAAPPGRWRVQVSVPAAELQEIVPAARLLQSATSLSPAEYARAKAAFLQAIEKASIKAADLNTQLRAMAEQAQPGTAGNSAAARSSSASPSSKDGGRDSTAGLQLPGLQDLRGQWSGSFQAYGGGGGATSCDFDLRGQGWQWGSSYALDALVGAGSYHSEEGLQLQECVLKAGDAKLSVRGSLLGEHQDASLLLTDFPMTTLRPIFRAVPALQNAAPAVPAERPQPVASPRPLGMLTNALGRATKGLQQGGQGTDSPINGLLYVSGNITGSRAQPTGEVAVRLYDAAVGPTRLSQAQASARLNEAQQLSFSVEVVPAEGHRQAGYVRAAGMVPLAEAAAGSSNKAGEVAAVQPGPLPPPATQQQQQQQQQQMDVRLSVKDGGMAVLTSITPDVQWQGGQAAIDVRLRGFPDQPVLSGSASISKATLDCPVLRFPLTNVTAEVRAGDDLLTVDALEARCGRRGHIRVRGSLPVYGQAAAAARRLVAEASGLELRLRNMYSGQYDAALALTNSLASPTVAGSMRFSKGIVFIVPQGAPDVAGAASGSTGNALLTPSAGGGQAGSVAKVFEILTRGESGLAQQFEQVMKQEVEAVEHIVEDAGQHNVSLDGLSICLGPDLRAMYPLVMNFGVEGELTVSGPAHPDQVRVRGTVRLPSGDVNLVATQLALDREHANLITFTSESGLDPLVDLVMSGGDLRVAIQGRASEWQDHLTLHYASDRTARPGDSGEQLEPADAARIFEDKLKAALLAEDGQLALSRLAGTTVSTLMPKIETQGQVGGTRWRLVSAPSIPGLLSLDPSLADPSNILSSITMGTEVEIQFGKKLQATMVRKLQESDVTTQWSLNYKLNNKLRMQFNITSAPPFPKTLLFQFSSEGGAT